MVSVNNDINNCCVGTYDKCVHGIRKEVLRRVVMAKVAMERLLRKIIYHFQKLTMKLRRPLTTKVSKVFGLQKTPSRG